MNSSHDLQRKLSARPWGQRKEELAGHGWLWVPQPRWRLARLLGFIKAGAKILPDTSDILAKDVHAQSKLKGN